MNFLVLSGITSTQSQEIEGESFGTCESVPGTLFSEAYGMLCLNQTSARNTSCRAYDEEIDLEQRARNCCEGASKNTAGEAGACPQCVEKCRREHRSQTAPGAFGHFTSAHERHPSFLRTALENNLRSTMSIPKAFMDVHGKNLRGSTVDLEGANGKVWLVIVEAASSGVTSFRFGWQVFAADNNLKAGDSILFTLVSRNRFSVRVFSRVGLEIDEPGKLPHHFTNSRGSRFAPESESKGAVHINLDECLSEDEFIGTTSSTYLGPSERLWKDFRADSADSGHGHRGPSILEILKSHGHLIGERNKSRGLKSHEKARRHYINQQGKSLDSGWNSTVWESRRRLITDVERQRVVIASKELVTVHPSIPVLMKPSHVYRGFWLTIPLEFSRKHMPSTGAHITLQDAFGYKWPAKWVVSGHHSGVSDGWAAFSRDHRLEEGDVCVFEILDSKDSILLVHIFRVVEVPLQPGSRGGWDVAYNVVVKRPPGNPPGRGFPPTRSFSHTDHGHLPNLNEGVPHGFAVKTEPSVDVNLHKRPRLAQVLLEMVQNGEFSKQYREKGMLDEETKPDIKSPELLNAGQFKDRSHRPIKLASDSVKAEPKDMCHMTPITLLPSPLVFKTEPAASDSKDENVPTKPPMTVYTRRPRKEGSTASKSIESEKKAGERILYPLAA